MLKKLVFSFLLIAFSTLQAATPLRLATTTSTENSGLLAELLPRFTEETGIPVHVIAVGTGKALRLGRDGDVDVVLVHAPAAEKAFVEAGYGEQRHPVMHNDFVIVGPADDPAGVGAARDAADALRRIARHGSLFVSRGDNSGTHKKELALWKEAGLKPEGNWYREVGQGMGKVLQMADQLQAYTLTDRGTWLAYTGRLDLKIVHEGDPSLFNPYGIIAVSRERYPDINHAAATRLIEWITDPQRGQKLIGDFRLKGQQLFIPDVK